MADLLRDWPTDLERTQVDHAVSWCKRKPRHDQADIVGMLLLLRLEPWLGVPAELRGFTLASWCWEGALLPGPIRGDYRRGKATAFGPFQMRKWWAKWCGYGLHALDDPYLAALCYWKRVQKVAKRSQCPVPLRWAQAMVANPRRYKRLGCNAESRHWTEYVRWQFPLKQESFK